MRRALPSPWPLRRQIAIANSGSVATRAAVSVSATISASKTSGSRAASALRACSEVHDDGPPITSWLLSTMCTAALPASASSWNGGLPKQAVISVPPLMIAAVASGCGSATCSASRRAYSASPRSRLETSCGFRDCTEMPIADSAMRSLAVKSAIERFLRLERSVRHVAIAIGHVARAVAGRIEGSPGPSRTLRPTPHASRRLPLSGERGNGIHDRCSVYVVRPVAPAHAASPSASPLGRWRRGVEQCGEGFEIAR
jgi:hypothetical protein